MPDHLLVPALKAVKDHATKTQGQSGHKFGSPHIQLWRTFLRTLLAALWKKPDISAEIPETLEEHVKSMEEAGVDMGHCWIRQARIKELKEEGKMLLNYGISNLLEPEKAFRMERALHGCFMIFGCQVKPGTAPPTLAEKKLQKDIDALKVELGWKVGSGKGGSKGTASNPDVD